MNLQIIGKQIETSDAYHNHVKKAFEELNNKFAINPVDIQVTISKFDHQFQCDINAHIGRGAFMRCHENGGDAYAAFDNSIAKLSKILVKHKGRLKNHHQNKNEDVLAAKASQYILSAEQDHEDNESHPAVIAELEVDIPHLTVGEAVMRLELQNDSYFLFYNKAHGRLNVVHYRQDGNIGWIDPSSTNSGHTES